MTYLFRTLIVGASYYRRQIRVSKIIVHKHFTDTVNDIALLRLGKNIAVDLFHILTNAQTREWIYLSSALPVFQASMKALLTRKAMSMVGRASPEMRFHPI